MSITVEITTSRRAARRQAKRRRRALYTAASALTVIAFFGLIGVAGGVEAGAVALLPGGAAMAGLIGALALSARAALELERPTK